MYSRNLILALMALAVAGCGRQSRFEQSVNRGITLLQEENYEAAATELENAAQLSPHSPAAYCNLGLAYWKLGQIERAVASLTMAADLDGSDPRPLLLLSELFRQNKRFQEARNILDKVNEGQPDQPSVLTRLALLDRQVGQHDEAKANLIRALEIDSEYPPALYDLAILYRDHFNDPLGALRYFSRYLVVAGDNPHAIHAREEADRLRRGGTPSSPRAETEPAVAPPVIAPVAPQPPRPAARAGSDVTPPGRVSTPAPVVPSVTANRQPDSRAAARDAWQAAVKAHEEKEWDVAIVHYKRALSLDNQLSSAAYNLGLVYGAQGNTKQARDAFANTVTIDAANIKATYMLAVTERELGNRDAAIAAAKRVLALVPKHDKALFARHFVPGCSGTWARPPSLSVRG